MEKVDTPKNGRHWGAGGISCTIERFADKADRATGTVLLITAITSVLLLTIHLLTVQLASCGLLVAAVVDFWMAPAPLLIRLTRWSGIALFVGMATGLIVGVVRVLLAGSDYHVALQVLGYKLRWGVAELIVSAVCMVIYLWGWRGTLRQTRLRRGLHRLIAIFAATNLMYHFPTLMLLYTRLASGRLQIDAAIDAASYRELAFGGDVLAGAIHFWIASLATTGVTLAWLSRGGGAEEIRWGVWGCRIGLAASLSQLPVGLWLLSTLPPLERDRLLGDDFFATSLLLLACVAAVSLMHQLATISFGLWDNVAVKRAGGTLVLVMALMVAATLRLGMG